MNTLTSPWIVRRNPCSKPKLRLFCLPHAGAGSVIFRDWHSDFPDGVEVCAVEPPGRLARRHDQSIADMPQFAETLASVLAPGSDVPFALFGYSLGALMAFECARVLRRSYGHLPVQLIVAAHKAPQLPRRHPAIAGEARPVFVREIERRYGPFEPVLKADPEMFDMIVEIMRADLGMLERYRYQDEAPLACPIAAIGGEQDASVLAAELDGWAAQTTAGFRSHWLPGGHFFLRELGTQLRALIRAEIAGVGAAA